MQRQAYPGGVLQLPPRCIHPRLAPLAKNFS